MVFSPNHHICALLTPYDDMHRGYLDGVVVLLNLCRVLAAGACSPRLTTRGLDHILGYRLSYRGSLYAAKHAGQRQLTMLRIACIIRQVSMLEVGV